MKTNQTLNPTSERGYALLLVMVIAGVALLLYAAAAQFTLSSSALNERNNRYNAAVAAAEGASELALSYIERDFYNQSFSPGNLSGYQSLVPTQTWATAYQFSDGAGNLNQTFVQSGALTLSTNLNSQFAGLYGLTYPCTVTSQAQALGTPFNPAAAVQQSLQLASIPVFQFATFYAMDLEIDPGPAMKITGKVHSNANLYTAPGATLEFVDDVTAVGGIYNTRAPANPLTGTILAPIFDAQHLQHVSSLSLPFGSANSPAAVAQILQPPPFGESPASSTGQSRYYNKVDLIVTTTSSNVVVTAGLWNTFAAVSPDGTNSTGAYSFIRTNASFFDQREGKNTLTTDIDVGGFARWITNSGAGLNTLARTTLGHSLNSLYVNDQRTKAGYLAVVRVSNGQQLPPAGLTLATGQPLYVQGHFNAPDTSPGSTNTSAVLPASLVGDAITVLSASWADTNSTTALSLRPGVNTTVNAAFLAGIVPTTTDSLGVGHYSGGLENFPRFLENWTGTTFTYNGSMVVMFPSQSATNFWVSPGTYYNPPTRQWAFNASFKNFELLPPVTPQVSQLLRGQWNVVAAH